MKDRSYFFKPRIGIDYEQGYNGVKTLVVGAAHICTYSHTECNGECKHSDTVRKMDDKCPLYKDKNEYYRLSNSNEIEITSFIEGDAKYPAYSAFTYYMTKQKDSLPQSVKRKFWDSVAFTNFLQYFLDNDDFSNIGEKHFEEAFSSFLAVCEDLKPDIIYVWNPKLRDILTKHREDFRYIGMADMNCQLSVYVFKPEGSTITSKGLRKLRYSLGIQSEIHHNRWYKKQVIRYLGKSISLTEKEEEKAKKAGIKPEEQLNQKISNLAADLKSYVDDGWLGVNEERLYFKDSDNCTWKTVHIGYFMNKVKYNYDLGMGANSGLANMFGEPEHTKYPIDLNKLKTKDILYNWLTTTLSKNKF